MKLKTIDQVKQEFASMTKNQTLHSFDTVWGTLTIAKESQLRLEDYHKSSDSNLIMITEGDIIKSTGH